MTLASPPSLRRAVLLISTALAVGATLTLFLQRADIPDSIDPRCRSIPPTTITEVLTHMAQYDGRLLCISGFYFAGYESSILTDEMILTSDGWPRLPSTTQINMTLTRASELRLRCRSRSACWGHVTVHGTFRNADTAEPPFLDPIGPAFRQSQ